MRRRASYVPEGWRAPWTGKTNGEVVMRLGIAAMMACASVAWAATPAVAGPRPRGPVVRPAEGGLGEREAAALPSVPTEQWRWDGNAFSPGGPEPMGAPLVLQLTDDDGNGVIDTDDVPDVLFWHGRFDPALTALDGETGAEHWTLADPSLDPLSLAAGDLDGDGVVEIAVTDGTDLVILENDGTEGQRLRWPTTLRFGETLGIADFDHDGTPEVYATSAVMSVDGSLSWSVAAPPDFLGLRHHANAADVDPGSPGLELLSGGRVFSAAGALLWQVAAPTARTTAVADLDGDGDPEIVMTHGPLGMGTNWLSVHDHAGNQVVADIDLLAPNAAAPVLADIDADGMSEILVPASTALWAFDWNGAGLDVAWSVPIDDATCCAGATAFDFDDDGAAEVVYSDHVAWYVFEGRDGSVLHSAPHDSETGKEVATVADVDGDCLAEVLVLGAAGGPLSNVLVAHEIAGPVAPRSILNQLTYHVTNVLDGGGIPLVEEPAWAPDRGWGAQARAPDCIACRPVVTDPPEDVTACAGDDVVLDGNGVALLDCASTVEREWTDATGPLGTDPVLAIVADETTEYTLTVTCADEPDCNISDTVLVTVHRPPVFDAAAAEDFAPCNLGIELEWGAATFRGALGDGTYNVYRSPSSCDDALARPPLATGIDQLRWTDADTVADTPYWYVVEAEDDARPSPCMPRGPAGGAVTRACIGPVMDTAEPSFPAGVFATLRARHDGQAVTFRWDDARPLLVDEHFHLLKAVDDPRSSFTLVNPEGDLSRSFLEIDTSAARQFFDLRVANVCEQQSEDEFPPGFRP